LAWFQDGTKLLVSGPAGDSISIWVVSVVGGELRKLRDDAWLATPSPNGSSIAFISPDYRELWLMDSYGQEARKLQTIESGATFLQVAWAPDGNRLAYLKNYSLTLERAIETCDLQGKDASVIRSDRGLQNFTWTPRGGIIATVAETNPDPSAGPSHSDLWEIGLRNGRTPGQARRLTNFAGFTSLSLSVTSDGKRLALIRAYDQSDVYVGTLEGGGARMSEPRRLTLDDRIDWPGGWMRDSATVLFYSDRQGALDIFRQGLDKRGADPISIGREEKRQPQLSPDGSSILYLAWPRPAPGAIPASGSLMRMAVSGGPAQPVLEVKGYPGSAREPRDTAARVLTATGYPDFRCPTRPGASCILAEGDSRAVTFSSFDALRGNKATAAMLEVSGLSFWDLSPDGSKLAIGELGKNDRIRIVPAGGAEVQRVAVQGFRQIDSVGWAADGASLFLTGTGAEGGSILAHVSLKGESQVLYKTDGWLERPMASPDGRNLAFGQATSSNNVWTIENFESK
jgi:Tol biopolymer transport system component